MNDERDNHSIHATVTDYMGNPQAAIGKLERERLANHHLSAMAERVQMRNQADVVLALGRAAAAATALPTDAKERKDTPIVSGVLDYFPAALAEVARVSKAGNDQHNPGQPMHHARGKSSDHADCVVRHLMERGTIDTDGMRHSAKVAWRALALLQEELEAAGAPMARGAR